MANSAELFSRANEEFVEENYEEAVKFYSEAIVADNQKDEYYVNRSHAFIKLEKFSEALSDAEKAIELNPSSAKANLRKGIACFHLNKFEAAKEAFVVGEKLQATDKNFATWIQKCDTEINTSRTKTTTSDSQMAVESPTTCPTDATPTVATAAGSSMEASPTQVQVPMPTGVKTRYDWYQTETQVVITIMLKNVSEDDLDVNIQERNVSVTVRLPSGNDYSLELDLAHPITPQQSRAKVMASKVELKLKKQEGIRWSSLESDGTTSSAPERMMSQPAAAAPSGDGSHPPKYPSSAVHGHDWDKLVAEITEEEKEEKPEGEAALNQLFQQIYSDGSDEVRKAMNKSFVESGGTVLSTNWNEIGSKKVDCKPPDGMEWKK